MRRALALLLALSLVPPPAAFAQGGRSNRGNRAGRADRPVAIDRVSDPLDAAEVPQTTELDAALDLSPALDVAPPAEGLANASPRATQDLSAQSSATPADGRDPNRFRQKLDGLSAAGRRIERNARVGSTSQASAELSSGFDQAGESFAEMLEAHLAGNLGAAAPSAAVLSRGDVGRETEVLLDRFSTEGPKPSERGDAFLWAQGAKPLALEETRDAGFDHELRETDGAKPTRARYFKRGERDYIAVPAGKKGAPDRLIPVDPSIVTGIVSDTVVDAVIQGGEVKAVRPIGSRRQQMMIGRVAQRGHEFFLEGLFRDQGRQISLFDSLPVRGGELALSDGQIVQAFIRATPFGFEAVPLVDLGRQLTAEIGAREIHLRHGAPGFFPEAVIREAEQLLRTTDLDHDVERIRRTVEAAGKPFADLRHLPFITIDPAGAGDLDDAFYIEREADGSTTWYLATADVARYVQPGSAMFQEAFLRANTFYSIDKDGVPEFPMNHPAVSKFLASLLPGKDSPAMITKMRFGPDGQFLIDQSEVSMGAVRVQGRYTYDQVVELWKGNAEHGIAHTEQIALARELAGRLSQKDDRRGRLNLGSSDRLPVKRNGRWVRDSAEKDPIEVESHRLIEELKVYGNRVIAMQLDRISKEYGVPHISRVHPEHDPKADEYLREDLSLLGLRWKGGDIASFLNWLDAQPGVPELTKQIARNLVKTSRKSAYYTTEDRQGHEGLALKAGQYDHPSTPIRRFSDMYNQALLRAYLTGGDPRAVHRAVTRELRKAGFRDLADYVVHLNGREKAAKQAGFEEEQFMSVFTLIQPENVGKSFVGYVERARGDAERPWAVIGMREPALSFEISGNDARGLSIGDAVTVKVMRADPSKLTGNFEIHPAGRAGAESVWTAPQSQPRASAPPRRGPPSLRARRSPDSLSDGPAEIYHDCVALAGKLAVKIPAFGNKLQDMIQLPRRRGPERALIGQLVGVRHHLRMIEYALARNYEVLGIGVVIHDAAGKELTELDLVTRNRQTGKLQIWEAKSARNPHAGRDVVYQEKVVDKMKLLADSKNRPIIARHLGANVDEVRFYFDVSSSGDWAKFLRGKERDLKGRFHVPVDFTFAHEERARVAGNR